MPMLFVRCHACQQPFPGGIAHDEADKGKVQMLGVLERCPKCHDEGRYDTHEFFFPTGVHDNADKAVGPGLPPDAQPGTQSAGVAEAAAPEPAGNRDRAPTLGPA